MKVFVVDVARCNGCHNCQIACKDEHCGNDWSPYAKPQPELGQFWCKVEEKVRGTVPLTRISYVPHIGAQTEALRDYSPEALAPRDDGLIVIDPEKAAGRKDLAEKFEGVFWNEELQIPQGCTGCAHLLDNGWDVPRCVDACCTDALFFGEEADLADKIAKAERLDESSHVYYLNLPKRFVGGTVVDLNEDEVVIGAEVYLRDSEGVLKGFTRTNDFGDFIFKQVEPEDYAVEVKAYGYTSVKLDADARDVDVNLGIVSVNAWQTQVSA